MVICVNSNESSVRVCVHAVFPSHSLSYTMLQSLISLIPQLAVTTLNMAFSYVHYVVLYTGKRCCDELICITLWTVVYTAANNMVDYVRPFSMSIIVCRIATLNGPPPTLQLNIWYSLSTV